MAMRVMGATGRRDDSRRMPSRHRDDWLRLIRRGIDELDRCRAVNGESIPRDTVPCG